MITRTKGCLIAVGLAALISASAMPSIAAPISNAAALGAAMSDGITQVRYSHRGWHRGYGFRSFGRAFNYSRGYGYGGGRSCYGCLGGRDGDGVPCRC